MSKTNKPEKKPRVRARHVAVEQIPFFPGKSKTQQHFREEVDINNIVAKFRRDGTLPAHSQNPPQYGDVTSLDLMGLQNLLVKRKGQFMALPAKIRNLFNNDFVQLAAFMEDPENHDQARKLGLLPPLPKTPPSTSPAASEPPAPPKEGV